MPVIPFSSAPRIVDVGRETQEQRDAEDARRYREKSDAKLKELMETPVRRLDPKGGTSLVNPPARVTDGWQVNDPGVETPNPYLESGTPDMRGFVPDEGDPLWNQFEQDRLRKADPSERQDWAGGDSAMGTGGPENPALGLTADDIARIKAYRAERDAGQSDTRMRQTIGGLERSPDEVARTIELSEKTGANRLEVQENLKTFEKSDVMSRVESLRQTAPKLRSWLDDPVNLEVAHDDADNLGWWEQTQQFFSTGDLSLERTGKALEVGFGAQLQEALWGLDRMLGESNAAIYKALPDWVPGKFDLANEQVQRALTADMNASAWGKQKTAEMPVGKTWLERGVYGAAGSAPSTVIAAIATVATRNPGIGAGMMGGTTAGTAYQEARESGKSFEDALRYGLTQGGIETATEFIPLKFLLGDLAADTSFAKTFFRQAAAEGITEQAATFLQDASTYIELNPDKTLAEFWAERPNAALETLVASTIMSGVQTTVAQGMQAAGDQIDKNAKQKRAEEYGRFIEAMGDNAANSKLLKRLPDKYREAVAAATKDGPRETVYIHPDAMQSLAQTTGKSMEELAQAFRIDPNEIVTATDTGEFIPVPIGNYAAVVQTAKKDIGVSGETIYAALQNDIKFGKGDTDFTLNEIKEDQALRVAEREAAAKMAETDVAFADSMDRFRASILEEVKATGLYTEQHAAVEADMIASIFASIPQNTGEDIETFWKANGARIVGALTGQQEQADGGSLAQELPEDATPTQRLIDMRAKGSSNTEIAAALYPDVDTKTATNRVKALATKHKAKIEERKAALAGATSLAQTTTPKLPMNEGSRMARAREMGFDVDFPVFHGSRKGAGFDEFQTSERGRFGPGVYFSEQPGVAGKYGEAKPYVVPTTDQLFDAMPRWNSLTSDTEQRIIKQLRPHEKEKLLARKDWYKREGEAFWEALRRAVDGEDGVLADARASEVIQAAGFKGIRGIGDGQETVIFDPKNIRRTDATFDPSQEGSSKLLAQEQTLGGTFTPRREGMLAIIALFQSRSFSTLSHEGAHWYLDTIYRLAKTENPHPFILKQWASILEWAGKSPSWDAMFQPDGMTFTAEAKKMQELFAETFEVYVMTAKAPSTAMRSVFATMKQWFLQAYKALRQGLGNAIRSVGVFMPEKIAAHEAQLGRRMTDAELVEFVVPDEIRQVFDRMIAAEDAIAGAQGVMMRDSEALAKAMLDRSDPEKKWTDVRRQKYLDKLRERYAQARERAEADLTARLIDEHMRTKTVAWNEEKRDVRREVASEIDEKPAQRAYQALTGIWRDTRETAAEEAAAQAEAMLALASGSTLPMDEASRMARAAAQGFDIDAPLYHGTGGQITAFQPSADGTLGSGVYLAPTISRAEGFAQRAVTPGAGQWPGGTPTVLTVLVRGNFATEAQFEDLVKAAVARQKRAKIETARAEASATLRQMGFDGIRGTRGNLVVFDPANIRDVEAAFDPAQEGSSKLLAQTVAPRQLDELGFPLFHTRPGVATTTPPVSIPPMRLNLQAVLDQYGEKALAELPQEIVAFAMQGSDVEQFVDLARNVRKSLGKKRPKSLWKFLSTARVIGSGNDKISYRGIRDTDGELLKIIGERKEAAGLIAKKEGDGKRSRSYDIEQAAMAAWEAGYFSGESPPGPSEFIDAIRADLDGTARLYARDDIPAVQEIADAEKWEVWFDQNDVDIRAPVAELRESLTVIATSQGTNAIGPDEAAELFNAHFKSPVFKTGLDLLQALKQGPLRNKLIRDMTAKRMAEIHGDTYSDGTIMAEAQAYARNEIQYRQFEIELDALAQAAGKGASANLAKQQAIENLRSKQVREVLNYNQWLTLERRWGEKAASAAAKGDMAKASEFARYRLINSHQYTEGKKLAEKIEKVVKHAKSFDGKDKRVRLSKAGPDYIQQIDQLLEGYEFKAVTKKKEAERLTLREWFAAKQAALDPMRDLSGLSEEELMAAQQEEIDRSDALAAMQADANVQNYKSLTVEELMAVSDQLDMIENMARKEGSLLVQGERRLIGLAIDDIEAQAIAAKPNELPPESYASYAPKEKNKRGIKEFFGELRTMQSIVRMIDGIDGGPLAKYTTQPLNTAGALGVARLRLEEDRVVALYRAAYGINVDELRKDQIRIPGIPVPLAKMERLTVALYWGTEISRRRIMDGYGWDQATVQRVLDTLDQNDWAFVQSVWDYVNSLYPEANQAHQDVFGVPLSKQPGLPIVTRYGVIQANYFPIKYNPHQSSRADQQAITDTAKQITGRAGTRRATGSTKERVKGKVTMPVLLDFSITLGAHVNEVVGNITTQKAILDAGRIIAHPRTQKLIVSRHGWVTYKALLSAMRDTRNGLAGPKGPTERIMVRVRNGATNVALGLNFGTVLKQVLGYTQSVVRLGDKRIGPIAGAGWLIRGMARMGFSAQGMQNGVRFILERSPYMRVRMQVMNQAIADQQRRINDGNIKADAKRVIDVVSMFMMQRVQFLGVDAPTWLGAYEKFTASGMSEQDAAAGADQIVIDSQGSGDVWQVSAFQRGGPMQRIFTNYITAAIANWNLAVNATRQTNFRNPGQAAIWAMNIGVLMVVPVIGSMAVAAIMSPGGDDDEEPIEEQYIREQIAFLIGPLGLFGQLGSAVAGFGYNGPQGTRAFEEASKVITETFTGAERVLEGTATTKDAIDILRPANMAAGVWLGYPAAALDRFVRGAEALWSGKTEDPKALLAGPPRE